MKKFEFLLLDANIIIELFRQSMWDKVVEGCDLHIAETIIDVEALYYPDEQGDERNIDLRRYVDAGLIHSFSLSVGEVSKFKNEFGTMYFEKLDPGESESLPYLVGTTEEVQICSADKIVFRVLGNMDKSDQGLSLEEILNALGLGRKLEHHFTKSYREQWTSKGVEERLYGFGRKT